HLSPSPHPSSSLTHDTSTTSIYTLSLHDALPISPHLRPRRLHPIPLHLERPRRPLHRPQRASLLRTSGEGEGTEAPGVLPGDRYVVEVEGRPGRSPLPPPHPPPRRLRGHRPRDADGGDARHGKPHPYRA